MNPTTLFALLLCCFGCVKSQAATWSLNELHIQHGDLTQPFGNTAGEKADTLIFTFQHASGWEYGGNFFFIDHIRTDDNTDFYGEWYPTLSSSKIFGQKYGGAIRDISFVFGVNASSDANVVNELLSMNYCQ